MPLDDLSAIVSSALSASSESELIDNFKTFSSKCKELSGRVIHSDIAVLGNRIIMVWDEMSAEGTGIFSVQSIDNGITWSASHRLSAIGTNATHPRILSVENHALVLWTEKQSKKSNEWVVSWL